MRYIIIRNFSRTSYFLGAQIFNIVVTLFIAWLMFGIVKPALWPSEPTTEEPTVEVIETVEEPTVEVIDITEPTEVTE